MMRAIRANFMTHTETGRKSCDRLELTCWGWRVSASVEMTRLSQTDVVVENTKNPLDAQFHPNRCRCDLCAPRIFKSEL